jgi:hypothetical protein
MKYTQRTKAGRAAMLADLQTKLDGLPVTIEAREDTERNDMHITITAPQIAVSINLCRQLSDIWLASWYRAKKPLRIYFPAWGSINEYHFSKATTVANDWIQLSECILRGIEATQSGEAFRQEEQLAA